MAVKKSELYRTLWSSCDKLRGGMDASQYKDYVLVLLFMKYVSDRAKNSRNALIEIPKGGGFDDLVALKGKSHIGDSINKVIGKLADANELRGVIDVADFNDSSKLGNGKAMVDRLSELIAIFENPNLDFSSNQADGDDLLGDAYEYLMMKFATESGKSKGQFYTPAEVSRIMAAIIGIDKAKSQKETIYDPTCGSGSLLLKAHDLAKSATGHDLAIYGQEMDNATAKLARMNMWLHNAGTAEIGSDNTLANPLFTDEKSGGLRTFDYVVANPPFSTKSWTDGVDVHADPFGRFVYGTPPKKNGDFAFLLHILASMKSTGKGAVILPHGVLFRGNAEATIRRNLIKQGYIRAIVGLPANLFYGTGIPACIILLDKEGAAARDSILMVDASRGFVKSGAKNRLRERDIHRIVATVSTGQEIDKFSRIVPVSEIADPKNDYNLNIPRYINASENVDLQDLNAHVNGGIPNRDIDALANYWRVFPRLRGELFRPARGLEYCELVPSSTELPRLIASSQEYAAFTTQAEQRFDSWVGRVRPRLAALDASVSPKELISELADDLLAAFTGSALLDEYAVFQGFMDVVDETLRDDVSLVLADGWVEASRLRALPARIKGEKRAGRVDFTIDKIDYRSELLPPSLILGRFFADESHRCEGALTAAQARLEELEAAYGAEDMLLSDVSNDKGEFTKTTVAAALRRAEATDDEYEPLLEVKEALEAESAAAKIAKDLEAKVVARYQDLAEDEIRQLVVDDKWLGAVRAVINAEVAGVAQRLAARLAVVVQRYQQTVPELEAATASAAARVKSHLTAMGVVNA